LVQWNIILHSALNTAGLFTVFNGTFNTVYICYYAYEMKMMIVTTNMQYNDTKQNFKNSANCSTWR